MNSPWTGDKGTKHFPRSLRASVVNSLVREAGEEDVLIGPRAARGGYDTPAIGPGEIENVSAAARTESRFDAYVVSHIIRNCNRIVTNRRIERLVDYRMVN